MWDMWWKKWQWQLFSEYFRYDLIDRPSLIIYHPALL
jgi:hypothetical protein